jgi:UDP-N-acetylglucosamine acyltransferase
VAGYPLTVVGINSVGLRRRGFANETIQTLEQTFKLLFFSGLNTSQAVERIEAEVSKIADVQLILDFISKAGRGLVK